MQPKIQAGKHTLVQILDNSEKSLRLEEMRF